MKKSPPSSKTLKILKNPKKALILLSGGMDSATALYWALSQDYILTALSVNFYIRSPLEREAVRHLCEKTKTKLLEVEIPFIKEASNLIEDQIPLPYGNNFAEGYVPQRNLLFYALAAYYAEIYDVDTVIGGHLASDPDAFPDSSPQFFTHLQDLVNIGIPGKSVQVKFLMPFAQMQKSEVVRLAFKLGVPMEDTWSCYWEEAMPCQNCVACKERAHAFAEAGFEDPLLIFKEKTK